ncbi:MAG: glycoside hydrolase family 57 [Candidatus Gracilibacteria bacterium]
MATLNLYTVFHINAAYSSLSEDDLKAVVKKCYWPLLKIIEEKDVKIGVEITGYSLEKINEIDSKWIKKLQELIKNKKCELIGSGYCQIIGPLVPYEVNKYNLKIGNEIYKRFTKQIPKIAYVNEQAYSSGLIDLYLEAGYEAIIMEWNNAYKYNNKWKKEWQYYPQIAVGQSGKTIPLIWNNAISFQKFQRYIYEDIEFNEYIGYLKTHTGDDDRNFILYGSDAEIFDFRPGRYNDEKLLRGQDEWMRISNLFDKLKKTEWVRFVMPSQILLPNKKSFNEIRLESSNQPIVVKKQEKYNITRWGLTGRDDLGLNTQCYKLYNEQLKGGVASKWKKLCYLWSSDFRTHIEEKRFIELKKELNTVSKKTTPPLEFKKTKSIKIIKDKTKIIAETSAIKAVFNTRRGLFLESLIFKNISEKPLVGTLYHGYYEDIDMGADYYSGHTIIEIPGQHKITDLEKIEPEISLNKYPNIKAQIKCKYGVMTKEISIYEDSLSIKHTFDFKKLPHASFHSGIITLMPFAFNKNKLFYGCKNGGLRKEKFCLREIGNFDMATPVSSLISAKGALGNTEGVLEMGDDKKKIIIRNDMAELAALPMIKYINTGKDFFLRVVYSLGEIDETRLLAKKNTNFRKSFSINIKAEKC